MIKARQLIHQSIGKEGCYLLCMEDVAREVGVHGNVVDIFLALNPQGTIMDNCFVNNPAEVMEVFTGMKWEVRKEGPDYQVKQGEYEVQRWERMEKEINKEVLHSHFIRIGFDPYGTSETVKNGSMVSKRIFRRL